MFIVVSSNIIDVSFFFLGMMMVVMISVFGVIFVDVEELGSIRVEFFDEINVFLFLCDVLVVGN